MLENRCEKCGNSYKFKSGLSKHRKKCLNNEEKHNIQNETQVEIPQESISENNIIPTINQEFVVELIKQNNEFKSMMMEMMKSNTVVNNTINNNSFNLNVFLNEKCKDAVNIMDFVNNLQIEFADLENVGHRGYIEGITQIILKHMKNMDIEKRPMHCTDLKRETMYIKDSDIWDRDNDNKKMKQIIGKVANKNLHKLVEWREKHPDCKNPENKQYDFCIDIYRNSLGGFGEEEQNKFDGKIIKNIAKHVYLDKTTNFR
uniref:C2H2-type domain-containing protein n=1 Tax=viral metagenome TaxID=1070528 RepID=A0A6C0KEY3_9ZZZZ